MVSNRLKAFLWFVAFIIVTSFSACKKSTYYQLTDEEMAWLVYKNNEVLQFDNQYGESLLFYITIRTKAYEKDGDVYSEFTTANFQQLNDTTAIFPQDSQGRLYIFKGAEGFLVTLTWPHFALKEVPLTNRVPVTATIGGIIYNDVFILDATGFTDLRNTSRILWVSQTYGVIQIEDIAGNTWVRQF